MKLTYPPAGTDERPTSAATPRESRLEQLTRRYPRALTMLVLTVLVLALNVMHIQGYAFLSPYDENHHIDYAYRAAHGEIVIQPDALFAEEILPEFACHGSQVAGWPECGRDDYEPEAFGWRGVNSAVGHPPYYYVSTGVTARALGALPVTPNSFVTWARVLGSAWLLLGCYLTLRIADSFRIKRVITFFALLLLATTPVLLHASTTVNSDASAFAGGALLLLACLAWDRGRSLWVPAIGAFACAALDPNNGVAFLVVLIFLGLRASGRLSLDEASDGREAKDYLWAALVIVGAGALAVLSWRVVFGVLAHNQELLELHPNHHHFVVDSFDLDWLVGRNALFDNFPPIYSSVVPDVLRTEPRVLFVSAGGFLLLGALFAVIMGAVQGSGRLRALALATLAALLLASPVLVLYNYISAGAHFFIPTRMLLSLLPAVAVVLAYACSHRIARVALAGCAIGMYVAAFVPLADRFSV
jgi:hypothetical protein